MKRIPTTAGMAAALLLPLLMAACSDSSPDLVNPLNEDFHPSLGVDLSQMTHLGGFLYIWDQEVGTGEVARGGDELTVHYTGYLTDGTVFDSSIDRGEPFSFRLGFGQVIPGWESGIGGMAVGGRRMLLIPPHLGYGEAGSRDGSIPPNATIVFVVDLLRACAFDSGENECL